MLVWYGALPQSPIIYKYFLLQSKDMQIGLTDDSKFPVGVNGCLVETYIYLSVYLYAC